MAPSIILVVDDEPVITQTLVLILNSFSPEFFAIGCTNVAEALTIVQGVHPDLVLLDAIMPGTRGLDHAVQMRDKAGCQILMMSGQGTTATFLDESNQKGNAPFEILAKPIHPSVLIGRIREILQRAPQAAAWVNPLSFHIH